MRLAQEVPGRKGLQRQAKCFLAAMNALRLVNENYAWIVKPVTTDKDMVSKLIRDLKRHFFLFVDNVTHQSENFNL